MWGERRENGLWIASRSRYRFLFREHDALYLAVGRLRLRIMKPRRSRAARQIRWCSDYIRRTYSSPHDRPDWYGDGPGT